MASSIKGKALLIIERLDSAYVPFDVRVTALTAPNEGCRHSAYEDFSLLDTDTLALPSAAYRLPIGGRIWVKVVYELSYYRDYDGECDVDLDFVKQRTIKRSIPKRAARALPDTGKEKE